MHIFLPIRFSCLFRSRTKSLLFRSRTKSRPSFAGDVEREQLHATVPIRRLLLVREVKRAGMQEHHLDRRVHRPTPQSQDRQLHTYCLINRYYPFLVAYLVQVP